MLRRTSTKRWLVRAALLLVVTTIPVALWLGSREVQRDECFFGDGSVRDGSALSAYTGLTVQDAKQRATGEGHVLRVVGEDGECADRTSDLRRDRINVYVDDGTVVGVRAY